MAGGQHPGPLRPVGKRQAQFAVSQCSPILLRDYPTAGIIGSQLAKLHQTQSRANFIDAIVISQSHHIIAISMTLVTIPGQTGHAMRAHQAQLFRQVVTIRRQHPSFTGGDIFI